VGTQDWLSLVIYFGVFMLVFYIFIIMPRKKQEKKHGELLANLKKGDKVVTIGGIYGEVSRIKDDKVVLKVNEETKIEFMKKAIAYKVEE